MQEIIISKTQKKILTDHAENEKPNESCAILFGKIKEQRITVNEIFLTQNVDESPINFTISNDQLIYAYKIAEQKRLEVVGIFHSHPNSEAYPSSTDKKFMQCNPVVWVIYSGISNNFKAFMLETEVIEIQIQQ